jgi:UDP-glucose 4-epimerase
MLKKALIIGAGGFLGQAIAREMTCHGWATYGVDSLWRNHNYSEWFCNCRTLTLPDQSFREFLNDAAPQAIIHCAGRSSVPGSFENPHADFKSHVVLTEWLLNLIEALTTKSQLIYLSSAAVYGQPKKLPILESDEVRPLSPYGYHKRMAELLCEQAGNLRGIHTTILRIFSAYGPGLNRQVIWEACRQAIDTDRIHLFGTGLESRDFIHSKDIAKSVRFLCESDHPGGVYNIGAGKETTIQHIAEVIGSLSGVKNIKFKGTHRKGDPNNWCADISKITSLGFLPDIGIEIGIEEVFAFMK